MAGLDISKIELFGPVAITVNGVNCGHTDEEGVKCPLTTQIVEAMAGKYGSNAPVGVWLNGQRLEIEFNLIQTDLEAASAGGLEECLPGATLVSSAGKEKLTFGKIAGTKLTPVTMVLSSHVTAQTPKFDLSCYAVPIGDFELTYTAEGHNKWACKFLATINEAGGAAGSYLATFGDATATADVVAPTVSAVLPVDGAAAQPVDVNVVWTMSEDLNLNTVDEFSVFLFEDAEGAGLGVQIAGAVTAVNAGAATAITFNPTAALTGGTTYVAVLTSAIKDLAGNALATAYISNFDTV